MSVLRAALAVLLLAVLANAAAAQRTPPPAPRPSPPPAPRPTPPAPAPAPRVTPLATPPAPRISTPTTPPASPPPRQIAGWTAPRSFFTPTPSAGSGAFSRLEGHHMFPRAFGNSMSLGDKGLTLLGQNQHRDIHAAMRSYFRSDPRFYRPHPDTGKPVNIYSRAALNVGGSRPAFDIQTRMKALDGFYRAYQGGKYLEQFRREASFAAGAKKLK